MATKQTLTKPKAPRKSRAAAPASPKPPVTHDRIVPAEARAAIETWTAEELAEAEAARQHDEIMARTLEAKIGGAAVNEDSHDPLTFDDVPAPARIAEPQLSASVESIRSMSPNDGVGFEQARPEMLFRTKPADSFGQRASGDRPIGDPVGDPIAEAFDARLYNRGYSFDWCRDNQGHRHTFSFWFYEQGLIVDVYDPNLFWRDPKAVKAEVAEKSATIARRNAVSPTPIGYMAVVKGYVATPGEIEDARNGYVCTEVRAPEKPGAAPPDRRDDVRAASGDPIAARNAGMLEELAGWNRPREAVPA